MDINDLRSITTVISMLTFVGIVWWAYARGNKSRFDEAANLPFAEHDDEGAASASHPR
ncbi:MAG TPA: cbb3-type cytochrome c oxidase subunit 3 [Rhodocyclaceae bacterium]|nr:cbb3-type cytochrome c oxidase subunit 3 [Rhodocyclaceae bacterium]